MKDKIKFKVRVNKENFLAVQYVLFALGFRWVSQANTPLQMPESHAGQYGLIVRNHIYESYGISDLSSWSQSDLTEITSEQLMSATLNGESLVSIIYEKRKDDLLAVNSCA